MSEKIIYKNEDFFVNVESLQDNSIQKIFLFTDYELQEVAKNSANMPIMVKKTDIIDNLYETGAGYSVYGGSMGKNYSGRGGGFGGSSSSGGPNTMYTYSIVPLNTLLQQPGTSQGDERYVHVGSEIEGKVLGKDQTINGKILSIKNDKEGNILHYIVINYDDSKKYNIDPTSVSVMTHEERPDYYKFVYSLENFPVC